MTSEEECEQFAMITSVTFFYGTMRFFRIDFCRVVGGFFDACYLQGSN